MREMGEMACLNGILFVLFLSLSQTLFALPASDGSKLPLLLDVTLERLVSGLEAGEFDSVDLVKAYSARINEVNPSLHVVTEINPDAVAIAADFDRLRAEGKVLGPLHGIPVLLKNNIGTRDRMGTTAGSYALLGARLPEDSTVVARLRQAGVIILGKANLSQWANYRSVNSSNGWSADAGQTEGAYYPHQDPSGSSSGSAVAASLGLALATIATETDGSIISPASYNNVVGIKPTVGLTSRHLVIPISEHQDTVGPMAGTVKDAAYILGAIAGRDDKDNYTSAIPTRSTPDYVGACDYSALKGRRVGVPRNLFNISGMEDKYQHVVAAFNQSLHVLRSAGAEVVDDIYLEGYETLATSSFEDHVIMGDFVPNLASYLAKLEVNPNNITSLSDLLHFTQSSPREEWPKRDTSLWEQSLALGLDHASAEFWSNYTANQYYGGLLGITGALRNHSLDALVLPTPFASGMPAVIGSPVITVPLGRYPDSQAIIRNGFGNLVDIAPNVPFGIAFLGRPFGEEKLIGLAYAFEQRTRARLAIRPYLLPRTELQHVVARKRAL